jgi:hypothetical protein
MIEAMIESAMRSAELAEETGLGHDRIIISAKVSRSATSSTSTGCSRPAPTTRSTRADRGRDGRQGDRRLDGRAGDPPERGDRRHDPRLADPGAGRRTRARGRDRPAGPPVDGPRSFLPQVSACPGCGRTTSTFFQEMAQQIQQHLKDRMPDWQRHAPASRRCGSRSWAASSTGRARASTPTSGSRCPARSRIRSRPSSSTASSTGRSAARASWRSSSTSSRRTSTVAIRRAAEAESAPTTAATA